MRGSDGTLHVVYHSSKHIYYSSKPVGAASWSTPVLIPGQLHDAFEPDIAADSTDTIHVVWHEYYGAEGKGWDVMYATRTSAG